MNWPMDVDGGCLVRRFRVKVSNGISEEALEGIMGMVGKNLTVSDSRLCAG
jgi:hypothetical protein